MSAMAFDIAGWDTESWLAALPMLPDRATVIRTWRSRSFSCRLIRSSLQFMQHP